MAMTNMSARAPALLALGVLLLGCDGRGVAPEVFPDLVIVTESLPPATLGTTYSESVQAEGGDEAYSWSVSAGTLPPGLALTVSDLGEDDALITGVPDSAGQFTFTLTVSSGDGQTDSRQFTLQVVAPTALTIKTFLVPPALVGGVYDVRLQVEGGDGATFEWSVVSGGLPAGLELTADGRIQGTPVAPDTTSLTVQVRSGGVTAQRSLTVAVVANQPDRFNITIFEVSNVPTGIRPHLQTALADWHAAIPANLQPTFIPSGFFEAQHCGGFGHFLNGTTVDDLILVVNIAPIDGPGGVLGRAGPCGIRGLDSLPFAGVMTLDEDDLVPLMGNATLTHIISHEIAHVLGFGTLWETFTLIEGAGTADPRYVGARAVEEYQALGGSGTVPVENQGGQGTRDSHWRQAVFGDERMTGFSAPPGVFQPLSRVSVASFQDLGYQVNMSAADSFSLQAALAVSGDGERHLWDHLGYDEILREPIRVLEPDGRARTLEPR